MLRILQTAIVQEIGNVTDASIVVYNIYNPFQQGDIHMQADFLFAGINGINDNINLLVISFQSDGKKVALADAYSKNW